MPPGKRRPWLQWILYPLLLIPLAIPALLIVSVVYSFLTTDSAYRDKMEYSGELKIVEHDFRQYYHGREDYPASTLEELTAQKALTASASKTLQRHRHEFVPFTPATPGSAVVLTVYGHEAEPDRFTKNDLTADPSAFDTPSPATPYESLASPTP